MNQEKTYKTKQKEAVINYLMQNMDKHITAEEIVNKLKEKVGRTTVYRQLDSLVKENKVRKYVIEEGKSSCYQYIDDNHCHDHYHLKCDECGNVFHIDCEIIKQIENHLSNGHKFELNPFKTVLYGQCEQCRDPKGGKNEKNN